MRRKLRTKSKRNRKFGSEENRQQVFTTRKSLDTKKKKSTAPDKHKPNLRIKTKCAFKPSYQN